MSAAPTWYVLSWEDVPHPRDRGRFLAAQLTDLFEEPVSIDEGEALLDHLEELGMLHLADGLFRIPILDTTGWTPLLQRGREERADDATVVRPPRQPRVQATPPTLAR